jgi:hypothetical protein
VFSYGKLTLTPQAPVPVFSLLMLSASRPLIAVSSCLNVGAEGSTGSGGGTIVPVVPALDPTIGPPGLEIPPMPAKPVTPVDPEFAPTAPVPRGPVERSGGGLAAQPINQLALPTIAQNRMLFTLRSIAHRDCACVVGSQVECDQTLSGGAR